MEDVGRKSRSTAQGRETALSPTLHTLEGFLLADAMTLPLRVWNS